MKQETIEKVDELKELVSKLDNQRADFWDEDEDEYVWNGEELEWYTFEIFTGSAWYYDDEVHVKSVYVEDDKLYFDAFWKAYTCGGNIHDDKIMNYLEPEFVVKRYCNESQEKGFIETLEVLIELIKEII